MVEENGLNEYQIALVRTLWELAQGRINTIYSPQGAEEEKQAVEEWMGRVFPKECNEWIRAEGHQSTESAQAKPGAEKREV
jgi:ribosomal protein S12 methylthiotransferase accessory factor YcaO